MPADAPAYAARQRPLQVDTENDYTSDSDRNDEDHIVESQSSRRMTYLLFLSMGLATLLPWNLFISASEFYRYQFAGSTHQQTFQNSFSVAYMVTNFISNAYAMATVTKSDPNKRIYAGLVANTMVYVVGVLMPFMQDYRGAVSFYIVLMQLAVTAVSSGMLTNSLLALVSHFSPSHVEGVFSGQAVGGLLATTAQLITAYSVAPPANLVAMPSTNTGTDGSPANGLINRTVVYFAFATTANVLLTIAFWYVRRDPYYQQQSRMAYTPSESLSSSRSDSELLLPPSVAAALAMPPSSSVSVFEAFKFTFKQISSYIYVILLDFAMTLAVFPSVTASVTSTSGFKLLTEWHFFLYNCGDFLGRRFAPSISVTRVSSLMAIALARVLLIPAFFACHVTFSVWYNWIESDYVFLSLVVVLGLTNGFLSTRSAIIAPSLSNQPTIAGSIVAISISSGLAIGSVLSWPVRAAGCLCSPFEGK
ncbi:hypothetical protein GGI07_003305 [Coemansia sp. Benny D115]|nr:hypothetical protein GGI07_003305 [Coemansia sp. Benny D115]